MTNHEDDMNKSAPAPNVPGSAEFERFDNLFGAVITVPKSVIDKEEARWKRARAQARKKRAEKKSV
jgi:hypothetical protein